MGEACFGQTIQALEPGQAIGAQGWTGRYASGCGKDIKAYFESVLKLEPDNPIALNNMAFYLAENGGSLDEALSLAQRAIQKLQSEPIFSDTPGWIYTKKNKPDAGLANFRNLGSGLK